MMFGAAGLRTHIWNNNLKSILLLAGFPVLLTLIGYAIALVVIAMTGEAGYMDAKGYAGEASLGQSMMAAVYILPQIAVFATIGAGIWFIIAWFGHQAMINAATGASSISRKDEPRLYNLLENLCISRGMTVPKMAIIESAGLNAYASGLTEGNYTVTVTRGLMDTLNDAELEAVLAHELSHIRHRDVRLLVIAIIFVGIISFAGEIAFRGMLHGGMRASHQVGSRRGGGSRNGGALIFIALGCIAVAYLMAILIRFSLSRRREYMADAGAVELTRNPDAMISALAKISGHSEVGDAPDEVREMFIENPRTGFMGVFATHPPIEKRIEALVEFAGGHLPQRMSSVPQV